MPLAVATEEYRPTEGTVAFVSDPVPYEAAGRTLTLMLDKEQAVSREGHKLDQNLVHPIAVRFDPVLTVTKLAARGEGQTQVVLDFSTKVDPAQVKERLRVDPPVEVTLSEDYGGLALVGDFKPGVAYVFTLRKGLTAKNGASLPADLSLSLTLPDREPMAGFAHQGMFLPKSGAQNVAVKSVNTREAQVRIERVFRNNIFFCLNYYDEGMFQGSGYQEAVLPYLGDQIAEFPVRVKNVKNQEQQTPVDIGEQVRDYEPGLYRVAVSSPKGEFGEQSRWLLITDLGIVAKRGHDDLLVWVSSFKDLSAVAGAG